MGIDEHYDIFRVAGQKKNPNTVENYKHWSSVFRQMSMTSLWLLYK